MKQADQFLANGFSTINDIYTAVEVEHILQEVEKANSHKETFRRSSGLFAIRQFLKEVPSVFDMIFNDKLKAVLQELFTSNYFVVKSIYFDKPQASNWYVAYHQDLTISVDKKLELEGFGLWTTKQDQFAVQPPIDILQNMVTIRIHLDHTDEHNGALKVVPASHHQGICRPGAIDWTVESEVSCCIPRGGIMLMKPLLLHSSGRTTNNKQRRVVHIEFADRELPAELNWSERIPLH